MTANQEPTKEQIKESPMDLVKAFHAHLDICSQCEKHPFDLCPEGYRLLQKAATISFEQYGR